MELARLALAFSVVVGCSTSETETPFPIDTGSDAGSAGASGSSGAGGGGATCGVGVKAEDGVVVTDRGGLRGARVGETYAFKGIPYAAPPTGPLRWRPPAPATCWSGVRDATEFGSACVQRKSPGSDLTIGDEDCLTLNVWTPVHVDAPLPVLVFIHGGAAVSGSSSFESQGVHIYDGQYLAEHGPAVVVTLNYRLGSLGYLAHPALAAENEHDASGNYGTLDQIAALGWVKDNIASFGGDRDRLLLFGHSAGAIQTCALTASPLAAGLFTRALMLSGNCGAFPRATAEAAGLQVAKRLACDGAADVAACLRDQSAASVTTTAVTFGAGTADSGYNGSNVDGWVLPKSPAAAFEAGEHQHVPIIMSTTAEEYTTQLGLYAGTKAITTEAEYEDEVHGIFGAYADAILQAYPASDYESPLWALVALLSDEAFICPTRRALRAVTPAQTEPVWRAVFRHRFEGGPLAPYRAGHGLDLLFGFHVVDYAGYSMSPDEIQLADFMSSAWTHFADTGEPETTAPWAVYDPMADNFLAEDAPLSEGAGERTVQCDFWDAL